MLAEEISRPNGSTSRHNILHPGSQDARLLLYFCMLDRIGVMILLVLFQKYTIPWDPGIQWSARSFRNPEVALHACLHACFRPNLLLLTNSIIPQ